MTRLTVLVLFGGESSEHEVSIMSARNIYASMDGDKYDILLGYIDRMGKWWLLSEWLDDPTTHGGKQILVAPGTGSLMLVPGNDVIHPDIIFPVLHGKNGEDGTVQGLAQLLHIPIVGCDTAASAVTFDKIMTKEVLRANGIKTADFVTYTDGETFPLYADVSAKLGAILFVKPARSGSSIGMTKVHNEAEFLPAVKLALEHGPRVLIEESIDGRELETAIIGNQPHHKVIGIGEIIAGAEYYDFDEKYSADSTSQALTNIELPAGVEDDIRAISYKAYQVLACNGLARVDYLLKGTVPYVIEVNTIPGFTNISMYPKIWRAAGMHYPDYVDKLIQLGLK